MQWKRKENKSIQFYVNEDTCNDFNAKLELDGIEKRELLQSAINGYLYGNSAYKTKGGRTILVRIEIED